MKTARKAWNRRSKLDSNKFIKLYYPNYAKDREVEIAVHTCEKHCERVGRTANAKQFNEEMIDRTVEAHIRHAETDYDNQFNMLRTKRAFNLR